MLSEKGVLTPNLELDQTCSYSVVYYEHFNIGGTFNQQKITREFIYEHKDQH